jgi:hypothetical protein
MKCARSSASGQGIVREIKETKELLVQCMCEWVYFSLMCPTARVSEAPGFEALNAYFQKKGVYDNLQNRAQNESDNEMKDCDDVERKDQKQSRDHIMQDGDHNQKQNDDEEADKR